MSFTSNYKGTFIDDKDSLVWYHGSPVEMSLLRKGSSITRNRELAIAFSHKPTELSVSDNGTIEHNGKLEGYLYTVDEELLNDDIYVHEACLNDDPWEWLTKREVKLKLLSKTHLYTK